MTRAGDDAVGAPPAAQRRGGRSDAEERRLVKADGALAVADAPQDTETPDVPAQGDEPQDGAVDSRADQR